MTQVTRQSRKEELWQELQRVRQASEAQRAVLEGESTRLRDENVRLQDRARFVEERDVATGQPIAEENSESEGLVIVAKGSLTLRTVLPDGAAVEVLTLTEGTSFGELSLVGEGPRLVSAHGGAEGARVLVIGRSDFEKLMKSAYARAATGRTCRTRGAGLCVHFRETVAVSELTQLLDGGVGLTECGVLRLLL